MSASGAASWLSPTGGDRPARVSWASGTPWIHAPWCGRRRDRGRSRRPTSAPWKSTWSQRRLDALDWGALPHGVLAPDAQAAGHSVRICNEIRVARRRGPRPRSRGAHSYKTDSSAHCAACSPRGRRRRPMRCHTVTEQRPGTTSYGTPSGFSKITWQVGMLRVGDLASRVGVPKRTLHAAFQRCVGVALRVPRRPAHARRSPVPS